LSHRFYDWELCECFFKRVFNLSCGRVVHRVEKSKVLTEDTWEKDLDLKLSKRSLEVLKIHMWFMSLPEQTVSQYCCCHSFTADRLIFEIWYNFFYDLFSIKNVADVNSTNWFVSKRNMAECSVVIIKMFRSNWFEKMKRRHI
jgi:hypothetical protein